MSPRRQTELLVLLLAHAVAAAALVPIGRRLGPRAFLLAGLVPLATFAWACQTLATLPEGASHTASATWVAGLDLEMTLRVDGLAAVMAAVIGGIGALICVYAAWYFRPDTQGRSARVAPLLVAFAGSMLGLVLSDNILLLFVFWELTSVTSFLLIGTDDERPAARAAAQQALIITAAGGLALLAGLVLIGQAAGDWTLSGLVADPPSGPTVTAGVVLVLLGALTKSAQVPFNSWLPAAMAAPTPISAYLHSATMVKAGIYLVARLSPGFADVGPWQAMVLAAGLASLLVGGWRALRQHDLKLLLAHGTVSQLGLLLVLFGLGEPAAWAAGVALLVAHALYKAALFMAVGIVDHSVHSRDIRLIDGVGRTVPWLGAVTVVAALSMAGVPPLLGFVAKEAAFAAILAPGGAGSVALVAVVALASVLTVAYSARLAFGVVGPAADPDPVHLTDRPAPVILVPATILVAASVLLGLAPGALQPAVDSAASWWGAAAPDKDLALWHGPVPALFWSLGVLAVGSLMVALRRQVENFQARLPRAPGGQHAYDLGVRGLLRGADRVTGFVQPGSQPVYLGVILLATTVAAAVPLWPARAVPDDMVPADSAVQALVATAMAAAAIGAAVARRRFAAVVMLGAVGYGMAALFVVQGAPDLAVTQLLVETLSIVAFVLVLRALPDDFHRARFRSSQVLRVAVSAVVAAVVFVFTLTAVASRPEASAGRTDIAHEYMQRSAPEGGGNNVVNVIIVDFRGLDTIGEITVVLTAALGVAMLVGARVSRRGADPHEATAPDRHEHQGQVP